MQELPRDTIPTRKEINNHYIIAGLSTLTSGLLIEGLKRNFISGDLASYAEMVTVFLLSSAIWFWFTAAGMENRLLNNRRLKF